MAYDIKRLPSGQYGLFTSTGKRVGVYGSKPAAARKRTILERKENAARLRNEKGKG